VEDACSEREDDDGEEEDELVAEQDLLELGAEKEKEKAVSKLASSPVARSQSGTGRAYHTRPTLSPL